MKEKTFERKKLNDILKISLKILNASINVK